MNSQEDYNLENRVLDLISKSLNGITNKMLQNSIPDVGVVQLVDALNKLTEADKIQIFNKGKQLLYMAKEQNSSGKFKTEDVEEKLIYQIIENAGNKGIWIRDLRFSSNLPQTQVNKILKNLESKKRIKSVKSVAASKKKVYMLYDIEPDRTVTGGTWYSDQEFESEFVDVLNQQCYRYLQQVKICADKLNDPVSQRNASYKSSKDICNYINGLKVSKVQLSIQDIETILDTLIYDAKIEKTVISNLQNKSGSENLYRVTKSLVSSCGLMRVPCGVCPVHTECHEGGAVSPSSCPYLKEWLDF
ncbi:DNA-directed RNA polymerase III subunit RPC6-like [Uloborus diversus]|uniref:DNA-directed RNA polymerase III subunit RPC6-like n=1 Tax=Uloborus diversus TaxID=327109 RepID=UPI00240A4AB7|nr:DNA-directed RNA polymerase III subunit RPC6-like [Uloborus diversus]